MASAPDEAEVAAPDPHGAPRLVFLAVPEPKTVKNRIHLDLSSQDDDDQQAIVDRLRAAGATPVDIGQREVPWVVLADPDGNELCVLEPRDRYRGAGTLASVVIDAHDPAALARFWIEATGWSIGAEGDGFVTLHHPSGRPPDLDLVRVGDPKVGKNRVHLDLVAPAGAVDAEAHRLIDDGATRVDIGQGQAGEQPETVRVVGNHARAIVVALAIDRDEALGCGKRQAGGGDRRECRGNAGRIHVVERRLRRPVPGDSICQIVRVMNELGDEGWRKEVVMYIDAHAVHG